MPEFLVWYLYYVYKPCIFQLLKKALSCKESWFWLFFLIPETPSGIESIFGRKLLSAIRKASSSLRSCFKLWCKKRPVQNRIAFLLWLWSKAHLILELKNKNSYCEFDMYQYWDLHSMSRLTEPSSWGSKLPPSLSEWDWLTNNFINYVDFIS